MFTFEGNQCSNRFRTMASPASRLLTGRHVQVAFSQMVRQLSQSLTDVRVTGRVGRAIRSVTIVLLYRQPKIMINDFVHINDQLTVFRGNLYTKVIQRTWGRARVVGPVSVVL